MGYRLKTPRDQRRPQKHQCSEDEGRTARVGHFLGTRAGHDVLGIANVARRLLVLAFDRRPLLGGRAFSRHLSGRHLFRRIVSGFPAYRRRCRPLVEDCPSPDAAFSVVVQ